jgi:hypothetical protein
MSASGPQIIVTKANDDAHSADHDTTPREGNRGPSSENSTGLAPASYKHESLRIKKKRKLPWMDWPFNLPNYMPSSYVYAKIV